jgi:hypothetical protein
MSRRTRLVPTAAAVVVALLASSCSGASHTARKKSTAATTTTAPPLSTTPTRDITFAPLVAATGSRARPASSGAVDVDIRPTANRTLRIGFHETDVGDTGPQWEAAGRSAVAVATLITGAPLSNREIDFDVGGELNGLSAGALLTIAVIALIRGDSLASNTTMIGTINPDGSVGPAGGSPYKISDAVAAHKTRVLVPEGDPDGLGSGSNAVVVSEVADVFDAYRQFTGVTLPQLPAAANTRLDADAYAKIGLKVTSWLAKYQASANDFQGLAPEVRQDLQAYANAAGQDRQQAQKLAQSGSQAGAFQAAVSAVALMNAIAQIGQSLQVLLAQGPGPFVTRIKASQSITGRVEALVAKLNAFKPKSASDAGALISAYGNAIDALSLATFADGLFNAKASNRQQAINNAAEGAIYFDVAGTLVDAAGDILAVGSGLGGPALGPVVDVADVASFFQLAGEANLSAFESVVIAPSAAAGKTKLHAAEGAFAAGDLDYALAQTGDGVLNSLPAFFGNAATAAYARLGGALAFYDRTAELLAEYYSLGQADPKTLQLTGIANDAAFNSVIRRAQDRIAASIGVLRLRNVNSTTAVSDSEIASVDQNGAVSAKFGALGDYWDGYLNSRVLAYLGGFAAAG